MLVRDAGNDGVINLRTEIDFTAWDPTAKSDLQALLNVFDTNHDGKLSAADSDWSLFKVLVTNADGTTTLKTLSELGITEINLISNNQEVVLSDGSKILGTTTYTKSDGSTGIRGRRDVCLGQQRLCGHATLSSTATARRPSSTRRRTPTAASPRRPVGTTMSADGNRGP